MWMGSFARTLFSRTLLPWPVLCYSGEIPHARFSNTSFGRTLLGSNFGGRLLEQTFCRHCAAFPKRHININVLLWLTSRCPWDKRLVVPGLTGPKVYVFASKHRKYKLFPLVNRRVVPGLSRLSKSLCVQSLCAFFLPYNPLNTTAKDEVLAVIQGSSPPTPKTETKRFPYPPQ